MSRIGFLCCAAGSNYYEVDYPSYYPVHPPAPIPQYYQQQDPVSQYRGNMMMGSAGQAEGPMLREQQSNFFKISFILSNIDQFHL